MGKLIDLTGQRFGRLVVIERAENKGGHAGWLCQCNCGKDVIVSSSSLRRGLSQSCGCKRREEISCLRSKHKGTKTRLYNIWQNMLKRCNNPHSSRYSDYGGRGITVCDEWLHDFIAFRDWALTHGYRDYLTIDRINNDKGYSPDNCRWATVAEQNRNKRPRKLKK